jgi:hypothetical protein
MPNITFLPPQDELLRLTGSTGTPYETMTTTTATAGTGAYYGAQRSVRMYLLIAGAAGGTSPTLDLKFQDSADGSSYTDMGVAFPQQTTTMSTATGSIADLPSVVVSPRVGRPYLRISRTLGGTTPSFASVAVLHSPITPW